ncbi:MAG: ATP-binding cassette domain-containing protein [Caldilineales bacterium]|nr:ATP-binding cassette domain-containing protein [Caldilineales bacterium]MCW5859945.1 ATP-binding cassette domain-containing protein [Caldilineales bacterium]
MSIVLDQLTKRYSGHPVVNNVSLEVADGEFFVLLGSSGSGKTTVLSTIAGLTTADHGRVLLHGRDVTQLPPQERRIGFVFQNYALFQYMTVADNIEFGLSIRKTPKSERRRRRDELLELVGLAGLGNRMPRQLSGGQQQRVALARALAHRPEALLLDEPLGALDAKIRAELRRTLRAIQRELGITTILVTHDQEEAFELADRLGVMNFGRLLEVGPPDELYLRPQTEFVAAFLGAPNLLVGKRAAGGVQVGPVQFPLTGEFGSDGQDERVQVLFRPEDVLVSDSAVIDCPLLGCGRVEQLSFAGSFERLRLRLPPIAGVRPIAPPVTFGEDAVLVEATRSQDLVERLPLQPGQEVWVGVRRVHALAHPGLRFLIATDGSAQAQAALDLGGQIARLAHARTVVLGYGLKGEALRRHLQAAKEQLGSGLASLEARATIDPLAEAVRREAEREPCDLVVLGMAGREGQALAEALLEAGEHNLLLVSHGRLALDRALICVTSGEPGKDDVLFAGRLLRHLGAQATLLSVLPEGEDLELNRERAERFLGGGVRSLDALGVPARTATRTGQVGVEIDNELAAGKYDLLVLGSPLADRDGRISLAGVVGQMLNKVTEMPILIVRSAHS